MTSTGVMEHRVRRIVSLTVFPEEWFSMSNELRERAHEIDATIRVGKGGIDAVVKELRDQLTDRTLVKVKFLRSSRGGTTTEELATELAAAADAELIETRGHTAVFH